MVRAKAATKNIRLDSSDARLPGTGHSTKRALEGCGKGEGGGEPREGADRAANTHLS